MPQTDKELRDKMNQRLRDSELRFKEDYIEDIKNTKKPDVVRCKITGHVIARLTMVDRIGHVIMAPTNLYRTAMILFDNNSRHETPVSKKGLKTLKMMPNSDLVEILEDIVMSDLKRLEDVGLTNLNGFKNRIPIGIEA